MWRDDWIESWKKNVAMVFSREKTESASRKATRLKLVELRKTRQQIYVKHLSKLDKQISETNDSLKENCPHPLKFITVKHSEHDVGNEINYSTEHVGDNFYPSCEICGVTDTLYWSKDRGWENKALAQWQEEADQKAEKQRIKHEALEREKQERSQLERLKAKYG